MKRKLSLFLTVVMILSVITVELFAITVNAASESDLTFELNDDFVSYSVIDCNESAVGKLVIPEVYNGLPVTGIGNGAFSSCTNLTQIIIPESIILIGQRAFWNCSSLTEITIPRGVESTFDYTTFYYCDSLSKIVFLSNTVKIGGNLPWYRPFPEGTTIYGYWYSEAEEWANKCGNPFVPIVDSFTWSFDKTKGILTISGSGVMDNYTTDRNANAELYSTAPWCIEYGDAITKVVIKEGVKSIGSYAFAHCSNLSEIVIPDSVTKIGDGAFYSCIRLSKINVPDNLIQVGDSAFYDCEKITEITIPESVLSIGKSAFKYCYKLKKITFLSETTRFPQETSYYDPANTIPTGTVIYCYEGSTADAYANKYNRSFIYLGGSISGTSGNLRWSLDDMGELSISGTGPMDDYGKTSQPWYPYCNFIKKVVIADGVTSIGDFAFFSYPALSEVFIPDSVNRIGYDAFEGCIALTQIKIPDDFTVLGTDLFKGCSSLVEFTIPDSVTSISSSVFLNCSSLAEITIPDSVTWIGDNAFNNCDRLAKITILSKTVDIYDSYYTISDSAIIYGYAGSTAQAYASRYGRTFVALCEHEWNLTENVSATCATNGYLNYTCKSCGAAKTETIAQLPHTVSDWIVDTAPTCTVDGLERRECTSCHYQETNVLEKLGHSYNFVVTAPTCTVGGHTTYTCLRCNDTYADSETTKLGHNMSSATCTEASECSRCDHTEGAALGHDMSSATCIEASKCSRCDHTEGAALGHNFVTYRSNNDATCTTDGTKTAKCQRCTVTDTVTDANSKLGHSYNNVVTVPTCIDGGYTTHTCSRCNDNYTDSETVALGHVEVTDSSVAPTCTETGLTEGKHCSVCGESIIAQEIIPALNHYYESTVTPPTATADGSIEYICSNCDDSYTEAIIPTAFIVTSDSRDVIGYTGETGENLVIPAVFCDDGTWYRVTSIGYGAFYGCNNLISVVIPDSVTNIGTSTFEDCSSLTSIIIPNGVTNIGSSAFRYCSSLKSVTIPDSVTSIGFGAFISCSSLTNIIIPDSVTSIGSSAFISCSSLTNIIIPDSVTSIGDYAFSSCTGLTSITIPDSVTSIGEYVLSYCRSLTSITFEGTVEQWNTITFYYGWNYEVPATEVVCSDGIVCLKHTEATDEAVAPTCTTTGLTEGKHCSVCGEVFVAQEIVPALGHSEVIDEAVSPTCIATGLTGGKHCSRCEEILVAQTTVNALGHNYSTEWTTDLAPTCTIVGSKSHHCSRCGDKADVTEVSANGHNYDKWYEIKAPTCTVTGTDEHECSVCHNKEIRTTDAKGHTDAAAVVENKVEPNCTEEGSYDSVVYCSVCTVELSREARTIPMLGHNYQSMWTTDVEPTCTTVGSKSHHCSRCSDKANVTEIPALGHNFTDYRSNHDATYTENGTETSKCDRCTVTDTRTDEGSALGLDQKFKNEFTALTNHANTETTYAELYALLQTYATLSDEEKANVATEFATVQQMIDAYNKTAQAANNELADATEIAFAPIVATGFTFLAALWFLLKKKFFI